MVFHIDDQHRFVDGPTSPFTFSKGQHFPKFPSQRPITGDSAKGPCRLSLPIACVWGGSVGRLIGEREGCSSDKKSTQATSTAEDGRTGPSSRFSLQGGWSL